MLKRILAITFVLFWGISPYAAACYGEFCSTSVGVIYDYPWQYISKYTRPEYTNPAIILNDPQSFLDSHKTKLPIKACQKGKKKCTAAVRL